MMILTCRRSSGLRGLDAVPLCLSLRVLNLSCNQLADVRSLVSLVALEELDLSANNITSLGRRADVLCVTHELDVSAKYDGTYL